MVEPGGGQSGPGRYLWGPQKCRNKVARLDLGGAVKHRQLGRDGDDAGRPMREARFSPRSRLVTTRKQGSTQSRR